MTAGKVVLPPSSHAWLTREEMAEKLSLGLYKKLISVLSK